MHDSHEYIASLEAKHFCIIIIIAAINNASIGKIIQNNSTCKRKRACTIFILLGSNKIKFKTDSS